MLVLRRFGEGAFVRAGARRRAKRVNIPEQRDRATADLALLAREARENANEMVRRPEVLSPPHCAPRSGPAGYFHRPR